VAYKIFLERYFLNGGYKQSLTPYCAEGFLLAPGFPLVFAAAFWSLVTLPGEGWASYRVLPLLALATIILILAAPRKDAAFAKAWPFLLLLATGPVLYGLVIFRPEIFILLGGLLALLAFNQAQHCTRAGGRLAFALLALLLFDILVYLHPKAIYLAPFFFAGFFLLWRSAGSRWERLAALPLLAALAVWITASAIELHRTQHLSCRDLPRTALAMRSQSVNLLSAVLDPGQFNDGMARAFDPSELKRAVNQISYQNAADSGYLPPIDPLLPGHQAANHAIAITAAIGLGLALICLLVAPLRSNALRKRESVLISLLGLGLLIPFPLSLSKHWYDACYFVGALAVVLSLCAPWLTSGSRIMPMALRCVWGLLVLATVLLSAFLNHQHFTREFKSGYAGPGIPISLDRAGIQFDIDVLTIRSNLDPAAAMIVDDMTYEFLKNRRLVIPITYLGLILDQPDHPELVRRSLHRLGVSQGLTRCSIFLELGAIMGWRLLAVSEARPSGIRLCSFSTS
jgi:hypothetical protein